jgi:uncharacterized protein (TIGR03083 family)
MEPAAMLAQIAADGAALREAAVDLDAPVPTCPGWQVRDAVDHTAVVYAHKADIVETGRTDPPTDWPPPGVDEDEDTVDLLDTQLHRLLEALRSRRPDTHVWTWFPAEQSVGFWVRRMMHETVIHRADVESAHGPLAVVDDEVALDGIDELVERFLCFWDEEYVDGAGSGQRIAIETGGMGWTVTLGNERASFTRTASKDADARVTGPPSDVLLALWNRLPYAVLTTSGDSAALEALRRALVATTQ